MIIIISDSYDAFSTEVELWLHSFNQEHIRINDVELIQSISWQLTENANSIKTVFHENKEIVELLSCTVWHRRGFFKPLLRVEQEYQGFNNFLNNEASGLFESILMVLAYEDRLVGTHILEKDCRLFNHFLATRVGLKVPASLVTTIKADLLEFKLKYPVLVSKPIGEIFRGFIDNKPLRGKVIPMTEDIYDKLPNSFFPMFFQEVIERLLEIRLFVCKDEYHAVALSISNSTEVDCRFVPNENIRQVPFEIPTEVKDKIKKMLDYLHLDTASFDIIVDQKGDYYFLDLNPFGMLHNNSFTYYHSTEKQIANLLANHEPKPIVL